MISLPIQPSAKLWVVNEQTSTAKDVRDLLITGLATSCILLLTLSLLAHLEIVVGINTVTLGSLVAVGSLFGIAALALAVCSPTVEPSVSLESPEALKDYLDRVCAELAQGDADPLEVLQRCAGYIPLDMLQEATQVQDAYKLATHMLREAQFYQNARSPFSPSVQARLERARDLLVSILDAILMGFGVADFFKPSDSAIHADFKFQKIMMLLSLFTLLTASLLPMLGVTTGASVVGGIMLLIAILSIIWPRIRPPSNLPSSENWSAQIQSGAILPPSGRKVTTTSIYQALKAKSHVLLTGDSGVGKTQTAQAFAARVVQGEFPELSGKKVFYFNAADLVSSSDMFSHQNSILKRIAEAMGDSREDYILIIDEIHVAFQKHENNPFGDQFKTFLDGMPYVVGMTTKSEYEAHILSIKGAAGARRFDAKISIENTHPTETQAILSHFLVRKAPHALIEPKALQAIIAQTDKFPQPLSAIGVLNKCITRITQTENTPKFIEAGQKRIELDEMVSKGVVFGRASTQEENDIYTEMDDLAQELADLEKTCAKEAGQFDHLAGARKRLEEVREAKWSLVTEISSSGATQEKLNQLMLLKYYLEPALEKRIKDIGKELKIPVVIDEALVHSLMAG